VPERGISDSLIRLHDVHVGFAGKAVLEGADLEVHAGEIVTLIGPNGAGKTTLVRIVLGLLKPDRGEIWRKPDLRVGYMPQKLHRARAQAALVEVGAEQVIDSPLQRISGGEMQRVLLARALLREP
uniref:ATP-binding cassette domain-containing protein n=1 Tax=Salmonella enterica TaxID=28901 RepID=UPI003F5D06AF